MTSSSSSEFRSEEAEEKSHACVVDIEMAEIDTIVDMLSGSSGSDMQLPADWQPSGEAAATALKDSSSTGRSSSGTPLSRQSPAAGSAVDVQWLGETSTESSCYR